MKKIFTWLTTSNRSCHLIAGLVIMAVMMIIALFANDFIQYKFNIFVILSFAAVVISMCTVEFTQHYLCKAGKWDWLDILAGSLLPLLFTLLIVIFG